MKKVLSFIILVFSIFLIACDQPTPDPEPEKKDPILNFTGKDITLNVGDEFELNYTITNEVEGLVVKVEADSDVVSIVGDKVTAAKEGTANVSLYIVGYENIKVTFKVTVEIKEIKVEEVKVMGSEKISVGEKTQLTVEIKPENASNKEVTWSSSNEEVCTVSENGEVTAISSGTATIKATAKDGSNKSGGLKITVERDKVKPVISVDETIILKDCVINYNEDFDPLKGVIATDNVDGDITSKIEVEGEVNNRRLGTYELEYIVKDSQGNRSEKLIRNITVIWDYAVSFIGHGGSYSGLFNSEEAFQNAFRVHGYQGIECDLKQTKDGVFVMCHDDTFGGKTLSATNYDDLKDVVVTGTRGGVSYSAKICTLERYLQICKNNKGYAVIELKSSAGITNSDQSRMQALMEVIEKCGMLNNVVFLGSQYNCLIWTRENGYDYIPCQYLVNSCESETVFNRCVEYNLDVSFNIGYSNSQEWIKKYQEAGIKVACYTFSQYSTVKELQEWIDKGVDYVTVDVIKPYEVTLPANKKVEE